MKCFKVHLDNKNNILLDTSSTEVILVATNCNNDIAVLSLGNDFKADLNSLIYSLSSILTINNSLYCTLVNLLNDITLDSSDKYNISLKVSDIEYRYIIPVLSSTLQDLITKNKLLELVLECQALCSWDSEYLFLRSLDDESLVDTLDDLLKNRKLKWLKKD